MQEMSRNYIMNEPQGMENMDVCINIYIYTYLHVYAFLNYICN